MRGLKSEGTATREGDGEGAKSPFVSGAAALFTARRAGYYRLVKIGSHMCTSANTHGAR